MVTTLIDVTLSFSLSRSRTASSTAEGGNKHDATNIHYSDGMGQTNFIKRILQNNQVTKKLRDNTVKFACVPSNV